MEMQTREKRQQTVHELGTLVLWSPGSGVGSLPRRLEELSKKKKDVVQLRDRTES